MKFYIVAGAILMLTFPGIAYSDTPSVEDCYDVKLVRSWVELEPSVLEGNSFVEKAIYRNGDRIALSVIHAFTQRELIDPSRLGRILSIIRLSFSQPKYITRSEAKDPVVTRFLLSFLKLQCDDKELIEKILETENYVSSQVSQLRVVQ